MTYETLSPADIEAGKPVDNDLMTQIKDNEDALNAASSGAVNYDIPNGDMELTDASFPANWSPTTYPGGTAGLETTNPINGSQSMKFVHPGGASNGGGYADSDYMPCGEGAPFKLSWLHSCTAATMKNQVIIRWFDDAKVFVSADTLYDSIVNPAAATQFSGIANPVSTARFYKVRLVGGESSVDVAGTALFDAVTVERVRFSEYIVPGASATVEFYNLDSSRKLIIDFNNLTVSVPGSVLRVQVSADNGSTWLASTSYYVGSSGGTFVGLGTITNSKMGWLRLKNLGEADYTMFEHSSVNVITATPDHAVGSGSGGINTTTAYNAIKFYMSAGTIDTGTFRVQEEL